MNHLKENPIGIDYVIQEIQEKLYERLEFGDIDGYGRVYQNIREKKIIPEYYLGDDNYKEVLTNDKNNGSFFFIENEISKKINSVELETEIDIIFLLNLKKVKPNVLHRADEEVKIEIKEVLDKMVTFNLTKITKGIKALDDFNTDLIDMQPYHFIKFSGGLIYSNNC